MNLDSIENENGIIIAPAGTGKTESIVKLLNKDKNKVLILTHTNAGVETILRRIRRYNDISVKYDVLTIASFSIKYVSKFPHLSSYNGDDNNFENVYDGMSKILDNLHIKNIIKLSYSKVYVDEYQDCSMIQHEIIKKLSEIIDYKIFGDPIQCIFNFSGNNCVDFNKIVNTDYKLIGEINHPWRWNNGNSDLGRWTIDVRKKLIENNSVFLDNLPNGVEIFYFNDISDIIKKSYSLLKNNDDIAILYNLKNQANYLANKLGGTYYFQEEIACDDLKQLMIEIDNKKSKEVLKELFKIIKGSFIKSSKEFQNIISKINNGSYDFAKIRTNTEIAQLCISIIENFSINLTKQLIVNVENNSVIKIYRKELWDVLKRVINQVDMDNEKSAIKTLNNIRSNDSNSLKYKYKYLISRILLVKGLEFGTVLLVEPENLSKELFYVGISRPINKLIIATQDKNLKSLF